MNKLPVKMKDIIKSEYEGRKCKGFEYILELDNHKKCKFLFSVSDEESKIWNLCCLIPDSFSRDRNRCMEFGFCVPKSNMPLTTICTIGLKLFQNQLKEEIQSYTDMDSLIGYLVRGET